MNALETQSGARDEIFGGRVIPELCDEKEAQEALGLIRMAHRHAKSRRADMAICTDGEMLRVMHLSRALLSERWRILEIVRHG